MKTALVAAGTLIGLGVVAQFTWNNTKAKNYLMAGVDAVGLFAAATYTLRIMNSNEPSRVFGASGSSSKPKFMTKAKVDQLLTKNAGRIFGVTFVKKDGTTRKMTCRGGVRKYTKGGSLKFNPKSYDLRVVFDLDKMQYRMVPIDRVIELRVGGKTHRAA